MRIAPDLIDEPAPQVGESVLARSAATVLEDGGIVAEGGPARWGSGGFNQPERVGRSISSLALGDRVPPCGAGARCSSAGPPVLVANYDSVSGRNFVPKRILCVAFYSAHERLSVG